MKFHYLPLLCFIPLLTSCKNVRIASGADDNFIHLPEEINTKPISPEKSLFPTPVGGYWIYRLVNTKGDQEKVVAQPRRIVEGVEAVVLTSAQISGPPREELFKITSQEITHLSSTGGNDKVTMKPPMPLLQFPLNFDKSIAWQGGVLVRGSLVPSKGHSRLKAIEKVTVPAGTFTAYRVDSILETTTSGGASTYWTTRWFAPGVGMVKVRYIVNNPNQPNQLFLKELTSYKL
ncbi:hypothetical protein [Armatimonas sp.]|uniref:TapB family protein n=1 Tax=Armatimonas sp. TaxID=1872638 RepID=UPI00286B4AB9|nr:hypothetical protein [Armatimonas sp.]